MASEQSATDQDKKHNVVAGFKYWDSEADGGKPRAIFIGKDSVTNERPYQTYQHTVFDVSGDEDQYTLDGNGFQYLQHVSKEKDFVDEIKIETEYYPECEQLMKDVTGAKRVHIFNHKVRRGPTHWRHLGRNNLAGVRGPVVRAHVDQSYAGAELRLRWEFPDEADELLKHRYQIINIWRPITLIEKDPIAVADASSVPDTDLIGAPLIEDNFHGENWTVRENSSHRWYFKHHLSPEEVLLIKCFDSDQSVARRALHSAFEDPAYQDEDNRQSIEVRCLVLYDD